MYSDPRLQKMSEMLGLEEWENVRKPEYISELKNILEHLNESKKYPGARKDLIDYIRTFEDKNYLREIGYGQRDKLGKKLEFFGVIPPDNGSEERKTETGYTDDGAEKTVLEVEKK